jgi:hypothetical protein
MTEKWYTSVFATHLGQGIGIGAIILCSAFGLHLCDSPNSRDIELERVKNQKQIYILHEKDLNGNQSSEIYLELEGKKYFSDIDGKNLEATLNKSKE